MLPEGFKKLSSKRRSETTTIMNYNMFSICRINFSCVPSRFQLWDYIFTIVFVRVGSPRRPDTATAACLSLHGAGCGQADGHGTMQWDLSRDQSILWHLDLPYKAFCCPWTWVSSSFSAAVWHGRHGVVGRDRELGRLASLREAYGIKWFEANCDT